MTNIFADQFFNDQINYRLIFLTKVLKNFSKVNERGEVQIRSWGRERFLKINKRPPLYPKVNKIVVFRCVLATSKRNQFFKSNDEFSHVRERINIFVAIQAVHHGWKFF